MQNFSLLRIDGGAVTVLGAGTAAQCRDAADNDIAAQYTAPQFPLEWSAQGEVPARAEHEGARYEIRTLHALGPAPGATPQQLEADVWNRAADELVSLLSDGGDIKMLVARTTDLIALWRTRGQ